MKVNSGMALNDINEKYGTQEGYIFSPADSKEEANELIKKELMKVTQSSRIL